MLALAAIGCEVAQGYAIARPMDRAALLTLLARDTRRLHAA